MKTGTEKTEKKTMKIFERGPEKLIASEDYHLLFNRETGFTARWGKNPQDDPNFSPIGPELLDIEISTTCSKGCKWCAPAGTLINTISGEIPIEEISEEDLVIGYDVKNKIPRLNEVKEVYSHDYNGDIICIELESGRKLQLTPDHIVFLSNGAEIIAGELKEGDDMVAFL